jgi:hypothetical protein
MGIALVLVVVVTFALIVARLPAPRRTLRAITAPVLRLRPRLSSLELSITRSGEMTARGSERVRIESAHDARPATLA